MMMYQRKEKNDRASLGQVDGDLDLLQLLESSDADAIQNVKTMIHENICESKDLRLLHNLIEYYIHLQSPHALNILLRVKEPHDKHLLDKLNDLIKNENSRYSALQFLSNIVYEQPTWLYKISSHRVLATLLSMLKFETNAPNILNGLFILICLIPHIPSKFGPYLQDTFDVFSRIAAWRVKKPSCIVDNYLLHLHMGLYSLFHRLYGMFPCNFLAYLQSYYSGKDTNKHNFAVFSSVIKPMLDKVKLHPLLVTASKETELSTSRWKRMAYHDIVVESSSMSLDAIEGSLENFKQSNFMWHQTSSQNNLSFDSSQYPSISSQASVESEPVVTDSTLSHQENLWSPSHACDFSTPPPCMATVPSPVTTKGDWDYKNCKLQSSTEESIPLDFAVEAKPEDSKIVEGCIEVHPVLDSKRSDSLVSSGFESSSNSETFVETHRKSLLAVHSESSVIVNENISTAIEAKEEAIDKEVSTITSSQSLVQQEAEINIEHDNHFCSTAQNKPSNSSNLPDTTEKLNSLTKSIEEYSEESCNSLLPEIEPFLPSLSRFRYFSQCGEPPEILDAQVRRPKILRSNSCPAVFCANSRSNSAIQYPVVNAVTSTSSAFVTVADRNSAPIVKPFAYINLIPHALPVSKFLKSLSPPDLLDRYVQLGSEAYSTVHAMPIPSTKTTDWTHFGGHPPADEITILRNQLSLLHSQLLFERHRKDVHSERNRRILGRVKRSKMQEELVDALRKQIELLEQENQNLRRELSCLKSDKHQLLIDKQQMENDLNFKIFKLGQEKDQLLFSNKKLQNLLVSQKQENDEILEGCKKSYSEVRDLKFQMEMAAKKISQCQKLEKDVVFLSKQVILLQELNTQYLNKIESLKESHLTDIGESLLNSVSLHEVEDAKQKLDSKTFQFDVLKAKLSDVEAQLLNMKKKKKEQLCMIEEMKSYHEDEIQVKEERLADLMKISVQKDAHILSLHKDIESLSEEARILRMKVNNLPTTSGINAFEESNSVSQVNELH